MRQIWKFEIHTDCDEFTIELPVGNRILHLDMQAHTPQMWVEVRTDIPKKKQTFAVFGTGWNIPDCWQYIGTWQESVYVWHLYEKMPGAPHA